MENEIIEYGVCAGNDDGELAGFVNQKIIEGWQPYGFPFTTTKFDAVFFHQYMVKYNLKKKKKVE